MARRRALSRAPEDEPIKRQSTIRAVLFDLDNTLFDRDIAFETWARHFVAEQFASDDETDRADIFARILTMDAKGYRTKAALFADIKALYPQLPHDADTLCSQFYQQWTAYMALEAETVHLLDALDRACLPFGIVTNGSVQQSLKIDQLGLRSRTDCVFISEVFGSRKPEAAIFRAAASALNVPCEQVLFVGDNPKLDVFGAKAVGMTTAWLNRGTTWPAEINDIAPDYVLNSLIELVALLKL